MEDLNHLGIEYWEMKITFIVGDNTNNGVKSSKQPIFQSSDEWNIRITHTLHPIAPFQGFFLSASLRWAAAHRYHITPLRG